MWLTCSSIGRKLVMAITGVCLVLFVTFHCLMNGVAIFWPSGYNAVCEFLGANWYALVATVGLAALFVIHILYALWLTFQNRRARGTARYAVEGAAPGVEWSSKNMLVLGIVVLAFLVVHLIQFWAKMQLAEILHCDYVHQGNPVPPAAGTLFIQIAFSQVWTPIVYIIGFVALWFHMNHGFWSMFQTIGWDNNTWLPRLKTIACWWTSIVVGLFILQAIVFTVRANSQDFAIQAAQYMEWKAGETASDCEEACALPCGESAKQVCDKACGDACEKPCGKACKQSCESACAACCGDDCASCCGDNCGACVKCDSAAQVVE